MAVQFKSNKAAVMSQWKKNKAACLTALGLEGETNTRTEMDIGVYNAPVSPSGYQRTGAARASVGSEPNFAEDYVDYGVGVHYWLFMELGTIHMSGYPAVRNSLNNYPQSYENVARATLGKGFN